MEFDGLADLRGGWEAARLLSKNRLKFSQPRVAEEGPASALAPAAAGSFASTEIQLRLMSAKRKTAPSSSASRPTTATAREIISTCQIKTNAGTPVTWTAFRSVSAPAGALPDCYLCTLPDNTADGAPSVYNLRAIAAQAKRFVINLTALDQDVKYTITQGGASREVTVLRGQPYPIPPRGEGADLTTVTLTFGGSCCTIEAVPTRPPVKQPVGTPEEAPATFEPMDGSDDPPPPLPDGEGAN